MAKAVKYDIQKQKLKGKIKTQKIGELQSYEIKPKNSLTNKNILEVKQINLIDLSLIERLLLRKLYTKMESIIEEIDDNDDPSPGDLKKILDEVERLRGIIRNKYAIYLSNAKIEELLLKTNFLLQEVGIKAIAKEEIILKNHSEQLYKEEGKTR